jgi:hypothetical protein
MKQTNYESATKGLKPWTIEGFNDAMKYYMGLATKPLDDYDLRERRLGIVDEETNEISNIEINALHPMNQLAFHFQEKYDPDMFHHHLYRFMHIMSFISKNRNDLIEIGLIRPKNEFDEIKEEMLEALCILPFTKKVMEENSISYDYDFDNVMKKTQEIIDSKKQ